MISNLDILNARVTQEGNAGSYSSTVLFNSLTNESLIKEAYERIGISSELLTLKQISSALFSLNLILIRWQNEEVKQWMIRSMILPISSFKSKYTLLTSQGTNLVRDVYDVKSQLLSQTTSTLNDQGNIVLTGVASSDKGGTADNAFNMNPNAAFAQTSANGTLTFTYNTPTSLITVLGVTSAIDSEYTLRIETADYGYQFQRTSFKAGEPIFFNLPTLTSVREVKLSEIGGSTLNLTNVSFLRQRSVISLASIGRDDYLSMSALNSRSYMNVNQPTSYFFDKQIVPELNIYPAIGRIPILSVSLLSITYVSGILDAGSLKNVIEVPCIFYDALISELAIRLAMKEQKMDIIPYLSQVSSQTYAEAKASDQESTSLTITTDWSQYS